MPFSKRKLPIRRKKRAPGTSGNGPGTMICRKKWAPATSGNGRERSGNMICRKKWAPGTCPVWVFKILKEFPEVPVPGGSRRGVACFVQKSKDNIVPRARSQTGRALGWKFYPNLKFFMQKPRKFLESYHAYCWGCREVHKTHNFGCPPLTRKTSLCLFFCIKPQDAGRPNFSGFWAPRKQDSWNGFWGCPQSKQTASKQSEQRKQSKQAIKAKQASKASKQSKQSKASKQSKQSEASNASKANKQSKQSKQPKQSKRAKHASKASKATETNGSQRKPAETNGSARRIGALGGRTGGARCFSHSLLTPSRGVGGCPGRKCLRSQFPVAPGKYWE